MKTFGTVFALVLTLALSTSAFAASIYLPIDAGAEYLPSCGGQIEARAQGTQLNIILRGVEQCSNFFVSVMGREYKLNGQNLNRGGSYTIPAQRLFTGTNTVVLQVRSNSGAHSDVVTLSVRKRPASWFWLLFN